MTINGEALSQRTVLRYNLGSDCVRIFSATLPSLRCGCLTATCFYAWLSLRFALKVSRGSKSGRRKDDRITRLCI